ncbi:hypothetical protein CDAR_550651 [Caerostris darwini]|uniref:Uncharacterized protein n=1 Tax=Caerostris darwini TaxID=1538125 RepID=A0AAV4NPS3_9ARAC|nr:hypothetical protein CDAR_550651 [Caerostris darwini]
MKLIRVGVNGVVIYRQPLVVCLVSKRNSRTRRYVSVETTRTARGRVLSLFLLMAEVLDGTLNATSNSWSTDELFEEFLWEQETMFLEIR